MGTYFDWNFNDILRGNDNILEITNYDKDIFIKKMDKFLIYNLANIVAEYFMERTEIRLFINVRIKFDIVKKYRFNIKINDIDLQVVCFPNNNYDITSYKLTPTLSVNSNCIHYVDGRYRYLFNRESIINFMETKINKCDELDRILVIFKKYIDFINSKYGSGIIY